jgi:Skp family chaperone for outer membrane proteins
LSHTRNAARVLLLCAAALGSSVAASAGEQRLAMVNVSYLFENYRKVPEIQRLIDARHDQEKKALQKRAEDLGKRSRDLQQYFSDNNQSEAVFDAVQKLRKDQYLFERDLKRLNFEITKSYTKEMREVLSEIRVAIKTISEKGAFTLVVRSPDTDDPETVEGIDNDPAAGDKRTLLERIKPNSVAQLVERFNRNPVLFGAKTVDITQDVLTKLNDEYAKRSATGPGGVNGK